MKTSVIFKEWFVLTLTAVMVLGACVTASAQSPTNKLRVGVYDSRVIAVAYGNSTNFQDALKPIMAEHKKAKEAGDENRMKEIESQMSLRQRRMHEQGFSTGSVISIMATVKNSLPTIAKEAGVELIVSKWEMNYQSPDVEVVDVTDRIAALFNPSERGKKWLKDLPKTKPVPMEEITDHLD